MYIKQYKPENAPAWDEFVQSLAIIPFLLERKFMDYHAERFEDFSLLVYEKKELIAVLPAHRIGQRLLSHGGLSYGGLVWWRIY